MTEQIALLRKVAQRCSNLKGTTVKALWDATVTIAAASAALNLRAQLSGVAVAYPEWEDIREELRQLCADMSHLRASNETLKEDLKMGQAEQERLKRELEREREEKRSDRERERKEEERGEERNVKKPHQQTPPRDSSPVRLRPRTARRVIIDESEGEEDMEVVRDEEDLACPPSPVLDCRPKLGEIILPDFRPPLKGVRAEIEPEKPFEGPRDPPDTASREGTKSLTVEDMTRALETILPRLLAGMGLTPKKEPIAPLPGPDPGTALKGHTGTGDKREE